MSFILIQFLALTLKYYDQYIGEIMIKDAEVLVIHPAWMLVFILGYGLSIYVF